MTDTDRAAILRTAGLQVTAQRLAVYGEVIRQPHASADAIAMAVRATLGAISVQTVYDALGALGGGRSRPPHPTRGVAGPVRSAGR